MNYVQLSTLKCSPCLMRCFIMLPMFPVFPNIMVHFHILCNYFHQNLACWTSNSFEIHCTWLHLITDCLLLQQWRPITGHVKPKACGDFLQAIAYKYSIFSVDKNVHRMQDYFTLLPFRYHVFSPIVRRIRGQILELALLTWLKNPIDCTCDYGPCDRR